MTYLKTFCDAVAKSEKFVILDTETTGLHDGEICQIAIINQDGDTLLDTFVKTVQPIPRDASNIHRITDTLVANAPTYAELVPRLLEILDGQLLIVYNAVYDRKMMHKSAERNGLEKIEWKEIATWHCAMEAYAEYYGQWNDYHQSYRWQRLSHAAATEGVEVTNVHRASGDCLMTLGVVRAMLKAHQDDLQSTIDKMRSNPNIYEPITGECFMCGSKNWMIRDEHGAMCAKCFEGGAK